MKNLKDILCEGLFDNDRISDLSDTLNSYIEIELYNESDFNYYPIFPNQYYNGNDIIQQLVIDNKKCRTIPKSKRLSGGEIHNVKLYCTSVENLPSLFYENKFILSVDFSNYRHTHNSIDFDWLFSECTNLKKVEFGNTFKHIKITSAGNMFAECENIEKIDLSNLDFSKCEDMHRLVDSCKKLKNINFGNINTSNVKTMRTMFADCCKLTKLDLTGFDFSNCEDMNFMFNNDPNLKEIIIPNFSKDIYDELSQYFFVECSRNLVIKTSDPELDKIINNDIKNL
jgi:surface protein